MKYFIHYNQDTGLKVSISTPDKDLEAVEEWIKSIEKKSGIEMIEVGWFSYFLMKHDFPRLAMSPMWK